MASQKDAISKARPEFQNSCLYSIDALGTEPRAHKNALISFGNGWKINFLAKENVLIHILIYFSLYNCKI